MPEHITVVPADRLIIVNGEALCVVFTAPANLHALQWHNGTGHMEYNDGTCNRELGKADYEHGVQPFVTLWEEEKARREQAAAEAEAARLAEYNSPEARAARVRSERDRRISASDYLMATDYPLSDVQRAAWTAYRQELRDLPQRPDFPWSGGGPDDAACPWPQSPNDA